MLLGWANGHVGLIAEVMINFVESHLTVVNISDEGGLLNIFIDWFRWLNTRQQITVLNRLNIRKLVECDIIRANSSVGSLFDFIFNNLLQVLPLGHRFGCDCDRKCFMMFCGLCVLMTWIELFKTGHVGGRCPLDLVTVDCVALLHGCALRLRDLGECGVRLASVLGVLVHHRSVFFLWVNLSEVGLVVSSLEFSGNFLFWRHGTCSFELSLNCCGAVWIFDAIFVFLACEDVLDILEKV